MRNTNEKIARAAHIKPRTAGTSNEISFSVLDAASQGLNTSFPNSDNYGKTVEFAGRKDVASDVSRETSDDYVFRRSSAEVSAPAQTREFEAFGGNGKPQWYPPRNAYATEYAQQQPYGSGGIGSRAVDEGEIERRKKSRRRNKILVTAVASVVCVAVVLGAAWAWHTQVTNQQNYESKLVEALRQIDSADDVVMTLDELVNDPFADGNATKRKTVSIGLNDAKEKLSSAAEEAKAASEGLDDGQARQAANEAVSSITARQTMLETGSQLMSASQDAISGTEAFAEAWNKVLEADDIVREASKLTSSSETEASKAKYEEALLAFRNSRSKIAEVQMKYSQVSLSEILTYIDKRIESMGYAIASDNALIDKDKEEAVTQNDNYNKAETEASNLALSLPSHPEQLYRSAYSEKNSETLKSYKAARSQAGTSDTVIREYLGAEGK